MSFSVITKSSKTVFSLATPIMGDQMVGVSASSNPRTKLKKHVKNVIKSILAKDGLISQ